MSEKRFDFGSNWQAFSKHALTLERVEQAKEHFAALIGDIELQDRSFIDIGFGQGLSLLIATARGARTVGCDINPICADVLRQNQTRAFPELKNRMIPIVVGSILDENVVQSLRAHAPDRSTAAYDIVHSWGVLHHTGDMRKAIFNAASLVAPGGYFVIAIYTRHWSSGAWAVIKRFYNRCPRLVQRLLIGIFLPVIFLAKWLVTLRNPFQQTRGMDFFYNVVDWVGGYPYEYASAEQLTSDVEKMGFELKRVFPAEVPIGCNQFIFKRSVAEKNR
jgi:2-polyprenyl-6-hydroxyphenyl methylase/3-demethylubiquinone-9 3-methyltransferase